ncbi:hypothetical protein D9X30_1189 [Cupriavidus sp. U2]|nr:hypothetical protein D9X30_1189 [Cupriavidus sp. U2]
MTDLLGFQGAWRLRSPCLHRRAPLPSPACGRGVGGEGKRVRTCRAGLALHAPALSPAPLPRAGEGSVVVQFPQTGR